MKLMLRKFLWGLLGGSLVAISIGYLFWLIWPTPPCPTSDFLRGYGASCADAYYGRIMFLLGVSVIGIVSGMSFAGRK